VAIHLVVQVVHHHHGLDQQVHQPQVEIPIVMMLVLHMVVVLAQVVL
jgi:hypothetical protein